MKTQQSDADDLLELPLVLKIPRSAFLIVEAPPATVTQRTVERHFGIPGRRFLAMIRQGIFAAKVIGKLRFVKYEDVLRVVTTGAVLKRRVHRALARDETARDPTSMAPEAAVAYITGATTRQEGEARASEISSLAFDLSRRYGDTLSDGSPNPDHDPRREQRGTELLIASWEGGARLEEKFPRTKRTRRRSS